MTPIRAVLIHGMGRTPLAMLLLAYRLRRSGFRPVLFAYSPTFESWAGCLSRYRRFIETRIGDQPYIVVGHSLGTVLTRAVLPRLDRRPLAFFLLSPPARACLAALTLSGWRAYRLLFGEMGQLLADESFMDALPVPDLPSKIYAGDARPLRRFFPFGDVINDGILSVVETRLPGLPLQVVPALHSFIMNRPEVATDIAEFVRRLDKDAGQTLTIG